MNCLRTVLQLVTTAWGKYLPYGQNTTPAYLVIDGPNLLEGSYFIEHNLTFPRTDQVY